MSIKTTICTQQISTQSLKNGQLLRATSHGGPIISQGGVFNQEQDQSIVSDRKSNNFFEIEQKQASIDPRREEWTDQEEKLLIALHNRRGNKWVEIAHQLSKSDNAVKNHYHSKMRKGLRKINRCISENLKGQTKILKPSILSKIIQAAEELYANPATPLQFGPQEAFNLKNSILMLADLSQQQLQSQQIHRVKNIIRQIHQFNKNYKKKSKTSSLTTPYSCKYKGKEIRSLLEENNHIDEHEGQKITDRAVEGKKTVKDGTATKKERTAEREMKVEEKKTEADEEKVKEMLVSHQFQSYYLLNQPMISFSQLYQPYIQQKSALSFSGKSSSFSFYHPDINQQQTQPVLWNSFPALQGQTQQLYPLRSEMIYGWNGSQLINPSF